MLASVRSGMRYTSISIFTAVKIHTVVLWVMPPCSLLGGYKDFGGIYCLNLEAKTE
jgi:hypothetical protein